MLIQVVAKYAQALFEIASEKKELDVVERQLNLVDQTVAGHGELADLLYHPRVPAEAKKNTIRRVFADDLSGYVLNFLFLLVDRRREAAMPAIIAEFMNLANMARNIAVAEVTTARPLTDAEHLALAERLSRITCKNIRLKTSIDPRIVGGVVVRIGDKLIDGSVTRRLAMLRAALLKTEVTKIGVTD